MRSGTFSSIFKNTNEASKFQMIINEICKVKNAYNKIFFKRSGKFLTRPKMCFLDENFMFVENFKYIAGSAWFFLILNFL